ncbi:amyloid fiber anchoring/assembly protein TapA [Bacillus sp. Marseille-Q3570]|uniref:amyloid fiber anchoring/assembly protein TapA n=1 Tax=Bacillus sp. Marseille-Q3570 TaxID=2963522 RepID=UPI0021B8474E|nr:amyloid fiber anchoring/assembly protein TapA [Bacillus sp. Marseille-Q3570]
MKKIALLSTLLLVFSLTANIMTPFQNAFATNDWSKSSLKFIDAGGDCEQIYAVVKNGNDSGKMSGTVAYELYYIENGNPKNGTVVATGTIGPLDTGEPQTITFNPENPGNYMFKAYQEDGHPGTGVLWSEEIKVENCEQEPPPEPELKPLSISEVCTDDPDSKRKWEIHNPNDEAVSFHWKIKNSQQSGEATIAASSTLTLETDTISGDNILVVLYGDGKKVELKSNGEECAQEPPEPVLDPLVLQSVCTDNPEETRKWKITNPNNEEVILTWEMGSQSGQLTLSANETEMLATDTEGDNTLHVFVEGQEAVSLESSGEKCGEEPPPAELKPLEVIPVCSDDPGDLRVWKITNPNDEALEFTWKIADSDLTDTINLEGMETITLGTKTTDGNNKLEIWVDGTLQNSFESSDEKCEDNEEPPEETELEPPVILGQCHEEDSNKYIWKITNPNETKITILWEILNSEQTGTVELDANSSETIHTMIIDAENILKLSGADMETVELKADTSQCKNDEPIDEEDKDEDKNDDKEQDKDTDDPASPIPGSNDKLPNTATPWYNILLIASILALGSGGYLLRLKKVW